MKTALKTFTKTSLVLILSGVGLIAGCGDLKNSTEGDDGVNITMNIDEQAYQRAREILEKHPEDVRETVTNTDQLPVEPLIPSENQNQVQEGDAVMTEDIAGHPIPEKEAAEVMDFVDEATLKLLSDAQSKGLNNIPAQRSCAGDGMNVKTKLYDENVNDECLLPKMKVAAQLFQVKYAFARCIFEQENPMRDRLVHNMNGNGLAQITNITMQEIRSRWDRGNSLAEGLKVCLKFTSNRENKYLKAIDELLVPTSYNKTDIYNEARSMPPSTRLNPLYRDDGVCMGLMTMGIKVQEAGAARSGVKVADAELARRYNGSKYQQRYARAVVKCIDTFKAREALAKK